MFRRRVRLQLRHSSWSRTTMAIRRRQEGGWLGGAARVLLLPFAAVSAFLNFLMTVYDKVVYTPIYHVHAPLVRRLPRSISVGGHTVNILTANGVTLFRTVLFVPIAVCLKARLYTTAFGLALFHDYLDHLDGIVAKVQKTLGHVDDPLLGAFLDAFCDKVVNIFSLWTILVLADYDAMSCAGSTILVVVVGLVIVSEAILGVVRVEDYYHTRHNPANPRNLAASMEGKLKEKLESVGIMTLCLGLEGPDMWQRRATWVGITCLVLTVFMAYASLSHKLKGRTAKAAVDTVSPRPARARKFKQTDADAASPSPTKRRTVRADSASPARSRSRSRSPARSRAKKTTA